MWNSSWLMKYCISVWNRCISPHICQHNFTAHSMTNHNLNANRYTEFLKLQMETEAPQHRRCCMPSQTNRSIMSFYGFPFPWLPRKYIPSSINQSSIAVTSILMAISSWAWINRLHTLDLFLHWFRKKTFGNKSYKCSHGPHLLAVTQSTASKHWRKHKVLTPTSGLALFSWSTTELWRDGALLLLQ